MIQAVSRKLFFRTRRKTTLLDEKKKLSFPLIRATLFPKTRLFSLVESIAAEPKLVGCPNIKKVSHSLDGAFFHLSSLNLSLSANLKQVDIARFNLCFLNLRYSCALLVVYISDFLLPSHLLCWPVFLLLVLSYSATIAFWVFWSSSGAPDWPVFFLQVCIVNCTLLHYIYHLCCILGNLSFHWFVPKLCIMLSEYCCWLHLWLDRVRGGFSLIYLMGCI